MSKYNQTLADMNRARSKRPIANPDSDWDRPCDRCLEAVENLAIVVVGVRPIRTMKLCPPCLDSRQPQSPTN